MVDIIRDNGAFFNSSFYQSRNERDFRARKKVSSCFRVVGKERTGTNYVHTMVAENTTANFFVGGIGNKHQLPSVAKHYKEKTFYDRIEDNKILCIVVIKNPYTWFSSIAAWRRKQYNKRWLPEMGIIRNYNLFYKEYKELLESGNYGSLYHDMIFVRYEDMLSDEDAILKAVAERLQTPLLNNIRKPEQVNFSYKFPEEKRQYYINQIPRYGRRLIRKLNLLFDWETIKFYGYEKIEV